VRHCKTRAPRRRRQRAPLPQNLFSERIFNCLREIFFIIASKEKFSTPPQICLAIVARPFYHGTLRKIFAVRRRTKLKTKTKIFKPTREKKINGFAPPEE